MEESPRVFVPAHITAFFDPHYDSDPLKTGSRGAGFSITLGSKVKVYLRRSREQDIEVFINGKRSKAITTLTAIRNMIGKEHYKVRVEIEQDLPTSQGFGMSGAGALGASLALSKLMGLDRLTAIKNAHLADVMCGTGLGDVISQAFGGIEIRRSPGLPPWGLIEHIPGDFEVVVCIVGRGIDTRKVLGDERVRRRISKYGKYCLSSLIDNPSVERLFDLSREFMRSTDLASREVERAVDAVSIFGKASMCMIGNSVFAIGDPDRLMEVLSNFGKVYRARVDPEGARFLD